MKRKKIVIKATSSFDGKGKEKASNGNYEVSCSNIDRCKAHEVWENIPSGTSLNEVASAWTTCDVGSSGRRSRLFPASPTTYACSPVGCTAICRGWTPARGILNWPSLVAFPGVALTECVQIVSPVTSAEYSRTLSAPRLSASP